MRTFGTFARELAHHGVELEKSDLHDWKAYVKKHPESHLDDREVRFGVLKPPARWRSRTPPESPSMASTGESRPRFHSIDDGMRLLHGVDDLPDRERLSDHRFEPS